MSNLKHLNKKQLHEEERDCINYLNALYFNIELEETFPDSLSKKKIEKMKQHISGQNERLKWIRIYLKGKN